VSAATIGDSSSSPCSSIWSATGSSPSSVWRVTSASSSCASPRARHPGA